MTVMKESKAMNKWLKVNATGEDRYFCMACGKVNPVPTPTPYCPNCGAENSEVITRITDEFNEGEDRQVKDENKKE